MRIHFFTAPFYFAFIWFKVQVAASLPFLEDGILVSQPFPLGNAIMLRKSLSYVTSCFPLRGKCRRQ